jgi:cysteine desulfurase
MKAYLDNGATTRTDPRVVEAMKEYFTEEYGNPASLHSFGQRAKEGVEAARKYIASFINATPEEIVFTSGGTEADNLALFGVARRAPKGHIITSKIEHPAILEACSALEKQGHKITLLEVDEHGLVSPDALEKAITKSTVLVSIMMANNEIGTIQDIQAIGAVCKMHNVPFHTDAVQALGKLPIDVKAMNIDMLSASAHKLHGPKGVGLIYIRKGLKIEPLIYGGGHERGMRSGTSNTTGIIGFAKALELSKEPHQMAVLRDRLIKELLKLPDARLNGHPTKRLCNNVNVAFRYIEGEGMLLHLDAAGIAVSTGSACSSLSLKPSHVLLAIGLRPEDAHGSVRITLSKFTTEQEVDYFLENIEKIVRRLREMSPFGRK